MRHFSAIAVALWIGCTSATPALQGTWRSDRPLTLAELAKVESLAPKKRAMLERPTFFGELVLVIDDLHITTVLPYHRASDPYRVLERGGDYVVVESVDASSGERQRIRCLFRDGRLLVPVPELGFHEVFVRVTKGD